MSDQRIEALKESILIVDDATANLRLLSQMLSELGYRVRAVASGERALASIRADLPDLVLLDIRMPGMNGYEVCAHLKGDPRTRDIPVIFISALAEIRDKVQAFAVGGVDYITKPFQSDEVLARTETHLGLRRLQTQLRDANQRLQEANLRLEHELALAGKVQTSFLPSPLPEVAGWDISAALKPARQTSGDFYDAIVLPSGLLGLLVADVVDKGVGAALFMALSWILIRTYATEYPTRPELALSAVNHRLLTETTTGQFVTVFYGILDPATGVLNYCNAGHPPPFLCGAQEGDLTRPLHRTGMALGTVDTANWEQSTVRLNPGSTLLLYSDGVTDAEDEQERFFGRERLEANLRANLGRPAHEIQKALLDEIEGFVGGAVQHDDITMMVVSRKA